MAPHRLHRPAHPVASPVHLRLVVRVDLVPRRQKALVPAHLRERLRLVAKADLLDLQRKARALVHLREDLRPAARADREHPVAKPPLVLKAARPLKRAAQVAARACLCPSLVAQSLQLS